MNNDNTGEKPDFENIASHKSDIQDHDSFLGFVAGCEHVWSTYVMPLNKSLRSENQRLKEELDKMKVKE